MSNIIQNPLQFLDNADTRILVRKLIARILQVETNAVSVDDSSYVKIDENTNKIPTNLLPGYVDDVLDFYTIVDTDLETNASLQDGATILAPVFDNNTLEIADVSKYNVIGEAAGVWAASLGSATDPNTYAVAENLDKLYLNNLDNNGAIAKIFSPSANSYDIIYSGDTHVEAPTAPTKGDAYIVDKHLWVYNGSTWEDKGILPSEVDIVFDTDTNKFYARTTTTGAKTRSTYYADWNKEVTEWGAASSTPTKGKMYYASKDKRLYRWVPDSTTPGEGEMLDITGDTLKNMFTVVTDGSDKRLEIKDPVTGNEYFANLTILTTPDPLTLADASKDELLNGTGNDVTFTFTTLAEGATFNYKYTLDGQNPVTGTNSTGTITFKPFNNDGSNKTSIKVPFEVTLTLNGRTSVKYEGKLTVVPVVAKGSINVVRTCSLANGENRGKYSDGFYVEFTGTPTVGATASDKPTNEYSTNGGKVWTGISTLTAYSGTARYPSDGSISAPVAANSFQLRSNWETMKAEGAIGQDTYATVGNTAINIGAKLMRAGFSSKADSLTVDDINTFTKKVFYDKMGASTSDNDYDASNRTTQSITSIPAGLDNDYLWLCTTAAMTDSALSHLKPQNDSSVANFGFSFKGQVDGYFTYRCASPQRSNSLSIYYV